MIVNSLPFLRWRVRQLDALWETTIGLVPYLDDKTFLNDQTYGAWREWLLADAPEAEIDGWLRQGAERLLRWLRAHVALRVRSCIPRLDQRIKGLVDTAFIDLDSVRREHADALTNRSVKLFASALDQIPGCPTAGDLAWTFSSIFDDKLADTEIEA